MTASAATKATIAAARQPLPRATRPAAASNARTEVASDVGEVVARSPPRSQATIATRQKNADSEVARPAIQVTASVCAGCSANSSAVASAMPARGRSSGAASARTRAVSSSASTAFAAWTATLNATNAVGVPPPLVQDSV